MNKKRTTKGSKEIIRKEIAQIIRHLHYGERALGDVLVKDLKARSKALPAKIQRDTLIFIEQVHFQYDYDPWHKVTPEVQKAADRLLKDLKISH